MMDLDWQAWLTLATLVVIAVSLLRDAARPDLIFLGGLGGLLLAGVVTPEEAFAGFSNAAVLTVGALFVVAAGVQQTEALGFLDRLIFSASSSIKGGLLRLMLPTAGLSAFLNNTPIVAMFIPRVQEWARRAGFPASKFLIPLSYAAIVGGMMTLIGTSTNIVVSGLLVEAGFPALGLFDLTWVGLPAAAAVIAYFVLGGHRLLPDRPQERTVFEDGLKDCLFEVRVEAPLVGRSIEEAGLRALGEAYLVHVRRAERLVPASPGEILQAGDVLTFAGNVAMLDPLLRRPGLERNVEAVEGDAFQTLPLYEAVVADGSSLIGRTLREVQFRERFGGVVLAIQRRNERVRRSLGRLPIQAGDLLLIEASEGFDRRWNANRESFYLVAPRRPVRAKPQPRKAPIALLILLTMVVLVATRLVPLVTATFAGALAMLFTRCLSPSQAGRAVDVQVLLIIAAALGVGRAVAKTGLTDVLGHSMLVATAGLGVLATLVVLYLVTNVLTELITHKAAAVLMLPVALSMALELGVEPKAFGLVVAVAAAASFMTPIGYQTNLMVMSAGGYRVRDYLKVGFPVSLLVMGVAVTAIYFVWLR
ncbi:MAG: SLC13 family permease [Rhodothermales bacterium]